MSSIKVNPRAQIALVLVLIISFGLYFLGKHISEDSIQRFVESTGPWAPIVYILSHQISYVFAPISGIPFLIAGFYLFGKNVVIYIYISSLLASVINFSIAKRWGRPIVAKFAGKDSLAKIDKLAKEYGLPTLIALRLFLGSLGDFVSYAYGLTPMRFTTYVVTSALATIPGTVLWYFVAAKTGSVEQFLGLSLALTFIVSGIFIVGTYLKKKYLK